MTQKNWGVIWGIPGRFIFWIKMVWSLKTRIHVPCCPLIWLHDGLLAAKQVVAGNDGYTVEMNTRSHREQINGHSKSKGRWAILKGMAGVCWFGNMRIKWLMRLGCCGLLRLSVGGVAGAVVGLVAWLVGRGIGRPMTVAVLALEKVADGDLTATFERGVV